MVTGQQKRAMALYSAMMEEIKVRDQFTDLAINGKLGIPSPLIRELCYLQLRMIAELIALACLTAHGDIEATQANKLQKQYASDRIMQELAGLHANFYPEPMLQDPQDRLRFTKITEGFLTQAELPRLVGRCGDNLHRGSMKRILSGNEPPDDYADIREWLGKTRRLLNIHWLRLIDGETVFICLMADSTNDHKVQIALAGKASADAIERSRIGIGEVEKTWKA